VAAVTAAPAAAVVAATQAAVAAVITAAPAADVAAEIDYHGFLQPDDGVGISFWIISIAMIAATVFFFFEAMSVHAKWKTSLHVGMLVTLIAGVHYFYMREYWVTIKQTPIVYRYIDWSLTVPLQMVEFYLILKAVKPDLSQIMFWRLLLGTIVMLAFGYLGEQSIVNPWVGFAVGMAGWAAILVEIFFLNPAKEDAGEYVGAAFSTMRFIVTVGWSIYPLGYYFGYLVGAVDDNVLNLIYNLADMLNKIWFCLAIWHAAKQETAARAKEALLA